MALLVPPAIYVGFSLGESKLKEFTRIVYPKTAKSMEELSRHVLPKSAHERLFRDETGKIKGLYNRLGRNQLITQGAREQNEEPDELC